MQPYQSLVSHASRAGSCNLVMCGQRIPALEARRLTNACPPTRSCLLHRCRLAATLLALSPPSRRCEPHGSPSSPWLENPLPLASKPQTPPRPINPSAPLWLLAPSNPLWPICPLAPLGSLVPPALLWSIVDHPSPRDSLLWLGQRLLRQALPFLRLLLSPQSLRLHRDLLDPRLRIGRLSHLLRHGHWLIGSPSPPRAPPTIGSTMGQHYGCGLGST